jgi:hypothetical protein
VIDPAQLRKHVIRPTLAHLGVGNESWENLLLLTCATESDMGRFLVQRTGPALGIYQMEPATEHDLFENFLRFKTELRHKVTQLLPDLEVVHPLIGNLPYATAMAYCQYARFKPVLPVPTDWPALAALYKKRYNTPAGKGSVEKALTDSRRHGLLS